MKYALTGLICLALLSCKKTVNDGTIVPPPVVIPPTPLITITPGWKQSASYSVGLPSYTQVFTFDSTYAGKKTRAFCFAYDATNTNVEFKPVISPVARTTTSFAIGESGQVFACINGGYFANNQSLSLIKYNNKVYSANAKTTTRIFNNANATYYPTRAAFGVTTGGSPRAAWIYNIGGGIDTVFAYPLPSPNAAGSAPQPVPTALFPAGGAEWNVMSAIGGSPMLIYNKEVRVTDAEEMIQIDNTLAKPRSAIGYTDKNVVILVAIEGDNTTAGYDGLTLLELANLMKSLGCSYAVNLDGGSSTSMVVNGSSTVRPTGGTEKAVNTVLMIKKK